MNFLFLPTPPSNDADRAAASGLASGLSALGHRVLGPDDRLEDERLGDLLDRVAPDFLVSVNGEGLPVGREAFEHECGPRRRVVIFLTEHPHRRLPSLESLPDGAHVAVASGSWADFLQQHWPGKFRSYFVPHGAPAAPPSPVSHARRETRVALFADAPIVSLAAELEKAPRAFQRVADELDVTVRLNPFAPLHQVYAAVMDALGVDVPADAWDAYDRQAFGHVFYFVERSVRAQRQRELLRAFDAAGIAVDLWGDASLLEGAKAAHRHRGPATFAELPSIAQRSRVVALASPTHDGPAASALAALAQGAVGYVEETPYFKAFFAPGKDLLAYDPKALEASVAALAPLLDDPAALDAITAAASSRLTQHHSWRASAKALVSHLPA